MTPSPREIRRRRLALAALAVSVMTVSGLRERPVIGTLSFSLDVGQPLRLEAALSPPLAAAAEVLVDVAQRLTR